MLFGLSGLFVGASVALSGIGVAFLVVGLWVAIDPTEDYEPSELTLASGVITLPNPLAVSNDEGARWVTMSAHRAIRVPLVDIRSIDVYRHEGKSKRPDSMRLTWSAGDNQETLLFLVSRSDPTVVAALEEAAAGTGISHRMHQRLDLAGERARRPARQE